MCCHIMKSDWTLKGAVFVAFIFFFLGMIIVSAWQAWLEEEELLENKIKNNVNGTICELE